VAEVAADELSSGGEGPDSGSRAATTARIAGAVLEVNGMLYFSAPDNAWAVDARTGRTLWHYFWKTKGGTHIGNRGLGMYGKLALHGNAGRLSDFTRRAHRQGALA